MKSQAAFLGVKQAVLSPESDHWMHAAVRPLADHEAPLTGTQEPGADGLDLSRVPVRVSGTDGGHAGISCRLTPRHCPFGDACHTCPVRVQAKLAINQPGDEYEQEADRLADRAMKIPGVQLQRRATSRVEPTDVPPIVHEALRSPGQPMDAEARAFMEPRLGHNFSGVRVHTDEPAAKAAGALRAEAFTTGRDIYFFAGRYRLHSTEGQRLIAHELIHTIQQRASLGCPPPKSDSSERSSVGNIGIHGCAELLTTATRTIQLSRLPTPDQMIHCPTALLNAAIGAARTWIGSVVPVINSFTGRVLAGNLANLPRKEQWAARELRDLFGINVADAGHRIFVQSVQARLNRMQGILNRLTGNDFRCVTQQYSTCGPIDQSEAFVTGSLPIYICLSAFERDDVVSRPDTVLHEVAHLAGAMLYPETYSHICNAHILGSLGAERAINHAEHYACLVRDMCAVVAAITAEEQARQIMEEFFPESRSSPSSGTPR
jgi:hypothetical protein